MTRPVLDRAPSPGRRAAPLATAHGTLPLPAFLPDATRAGVRSIDAADLRAIGVPGVVVNTFHLMRAPGTRLIKHAGGVHRFMAWDGPVLSDSGGFQVYSLIRQHPEAGVIRPNEVLFREPSTGEKWRLSPEKCIQQQFQLGSDLMMCLDDCTNAEDDLDEQARAVGRTVRWAQRCKAEFEKLAAARPGETPRPSLFAVVQGGASEALRRECAASLAAIGFDGFGFGGWPIAKDGSLLVDLLGIVADAAPRDVPLHALGVGRPDHVVRAAALGYTMFDCSLPTRDARHHRLYTFLPGMAQGPFHPGEPFYDTLYIHDQRHAADFGPVDPSCDCPLCTRYSRAYLRHLFRVEDGTAERLATLHNLRFYVRLLHGLAQPSVVGDSSSPVGLGERA
ncbi:MAG TPA: tRNA guanosine(34) transglycosylase Tgt [Chloroflexota bacterium]|nr:tRNA guanosine(34) transglycosylase Tgt [Chloroflexota bacterium]